MMGNNVGIIGGSDGPTAIFIAGKIEGNWINVFGFLLIVLMLLPNIIYAVKIKGKRNPCTKRLLNVLEQIGRYGCIVLMVIPVGIGEFGFLSVGDFLICFLGNILLLVTYWSVWLLYFHKQTHRKQMALAVIPTLIFLLSAVTMRYPLLFVFALLFGIGHIAGIKTAADR